MPIIEPSLKIYYLKVDKKNEKRSDDMERKSFNSLLGKYVKVKYLDENTTCIVKGILNGVNDSYIIVNDVVIGLGSNFISCIPQSGENG